jgi:YHS domain-containing protein
MLRTLLYLILTAFVLTLLRGIVGIIGKAFTQATMGEKAGGEGPRTQPRQPAGGLLHKDPVCGVYVSESTEFRLGQGGDALYFCSRECLKKYKEAKPA